MAARRAVARTVAALRGVALAPARSMSVLAAFPYNVQDDDQVEFPRRARGLDYDLNWSLAADAITTRGTAFRNATVRDLVEFSPRGAVRVHKSRALEVTSGPLASAGAGEAFATDVVPGRKVMDVEEYESRLNSLRDECLSYAPQLFVEDAAVGSSRSAEVRVRVVTDSPVVALYFRNMLHRTPLYAPEAFPRTITVYAATLASDAIAAARGVGPYTVVDVDPRTSRGTVVAAGPVSFAALRDAVACAAAQLQVAGGYRHVPGGSHNSAIAAARADGVLGWYMRDGHYYAPAAEAHPELVPVRGDLVAEADGKGFALVVGAGSGAVAGPAAAKSRLYAGHDVVLTPTGVASTWAGVSVPAAVQAAAANALPLTAGAVVAQAAATLPLSGPKEARAPSRIVVVGGGAGAIAAGDVAARVKAATGMTDKAAAKLTARLAANAVPAVGAANDAEALKLLGL